MQNTIPHNQPCVGEDEIKAFKKVVNSSWLLSGEESRGFEERFKKLTNTKYAVVVNSGSSALHLSLIALNVKENDEVIIPTYTDSALLNVVNYQRGNAVIIDVEKYGFNLDIGSVVRSITNRTKAIIAPHTFGIPIDIKGLRKLGIPIVEDCAQALGSYYNNRHVGENGDLSIFSFYATKVLATGQGGMIVTNNKKYHDTLRDLIDYDKRDNYILRYNYQLNDIAAAIGNSQFDKLEKYLERRKYIGSKYRTALKKTGLKYWPDKNYESINHYRFVIKFTDKNSRESAQKIFEKSGVVTISPFQNYQMLHNLLGLPREKFVNSEEMSETTLSIPIFPCLSDEQVDRICRVLSMLKQ